MLDLNVTYTVAGPDVAFEVFDGDVIVLDMGNGKYYSFSDGGSAAWLALVAGVAPRDILASFNHGEALPAFIENLCGLGLMVAQPELTPASLDPDLIATLSGATEAPDFTVFDDMADLFVADPIHDVEEPQGWPVVKQA
jgi:hypothetical protein